MGKRKKNHPDWSIPGPVFTYMCILAVKTHFSKWKSSRKLPSLSILIWPLEQYQSQTLNEWLFGDRSQGSNHLCRLPPLHRFLSSISLLPFSGETCLKVTPFFLLCRWKMHSNESLAYTLSGGLPGSKRRTIWVPGWLSTIQNWVTVCCSCFLPYLSEN